MNNNLLKMFSSPSLILPLILNQLSIPPLLLAPLTTLHQTLRYLNSPGLLLLVFLSSLSPKLSFLLLLFSILRQKYPAKKTIPMKLSSLSTNLASSTTATRISSPLSLPVPTTMPASSSLPTINILLHLVAPAPIQSSTIISSALMATPNTPFITIVASP